jgi:two-component system sensor histidine kinase MprB
LTLRRRLSLAAAATVALAVLLAVSIAYLVVRSQLRSQTDEALQAQAIAIQHGAFHSFGPRLPGIPARNGGPAQYFQIVAPDGTVLDDGGGVSLPVGSAVRSIAAGHGHATFAEVRVGMNDLREYVFAATAFTTTGQELPVAIQLARPLNGVDAVLSHLRLILLLLLGSGVALAALLGRLAARRVLVPLAEVAAAARRIAETDDLSHRLQPRADDEVGQLARRFNQMLDRLEHSRCALDESMRAQRQLIADASHELRTPVTSLRTNIEVLLDGHELPADDRRRLLADVVEQSEELTSLVSDLIELARGDLPIEAAEEVRLDSIVEESIARARRNAPAVQIQAKLQPAILRGVPERLSRAVNNLLDNATYYTPPQAPIQVTVDATGVTVRDHGSGIDGGDLPYIFDRFFRGTAARGRQGSGLGLSIVRQVAEQHGGRAVVSNAPDGGAVFTLHLPVDVGAAGVGPGEAGAAGSAGPAAGGPEAGQPRLAGDEEAPAQQPEAEQEDGYRGGQDEHALAGVAEHLHEHELNQGGREGR